MTPEQREAAIERAINAWFYDAALTEHNTARERMGLALDAALSGFVVLHRDDVTEETRPPTWSDERGEQRRLVTRWEPINHNEGTP